MLHVASSSFKTTYTELTGRDWDENYEKVMAMSLELADVQQEIRARNHAGTSGRGKKSEEIRQWVIKEKFQPAIATGRGLPSVYDMEMLRLPKEIPTEKQKEFDRWMEKHKPTKPRPENAEQIELRQQSLLTYLVSTNSVNEGKTLNPRGVAKTFTFSFPLISALAIVNGQTAAHVHSKNPDIFKWLSSGKYVWVFPRDLRLYYAMSEVYINFPSGHFVVVKLNDSSGKYENVHCLKYGDVAYVSYWKELLPDVFDNNNGDDNDDDEEGGVAAAAAIGDQATSSSSSSSSHHVNSVPAATHRYFKDYILSNRGTPDSRLKQIYERPNPLCRPKGTHEEQRAAEELNPQETLQKAKDDETDAYDSWFNVTKVFVWDPLHQFNSHGLDRLPCKFHGFDWPGDRETAPVSETGQYRLRFVNDLGEPFTLASPRCICHTCVSRKKAIATRLLQRGVPDEEKDALQKERDLLTPYFTANDEVVLAHIARDFPAVASEFPAMQSHKAAISKSLLRLMLSVSENAGGHGIERMLDTLNRAKHSELWIKYYSTAKFKYKDSCPTFVPKEPPWRPLQKISDNTINMWIAAYYAFHASYIQSYTNQRIRGKFLQLDHSGKVMSKDEKDYVWALTIMNEYGQIPFSMNVISTSYNDPDVVEAMASFAAVRGGAPIEVVTLDNPFKDAASVENALDLHPLPTVNMF
jgi:hypothetical protein